MPHINLNGRLLPMADAGIQPAARAFRYGYGLFETMLAHDGRIRLEELHWQRLHEGMASLRIAAHPHFFPELKESLRKTLIRNGHERLARIRLQVWPGSGGYYDGDAFSTHYLIETFPLEAEVIDLNENGLVIGIAEGIIKSADAYSHLKSCNALPYALAARQAKERRWNDALLLNSRGSIADSSIANLFWSDGDKSIFTPPLADGCVAGVMRQYLLDVLPGWGFSVSEMAIAPHQLAEAGSIFLSNAVRGIRWVGGLEGSPLGKGLTVELHRKLLSSF